jgi:hypothetical protein
MLLTRGEVPVADLLSQVTQRYRAVKIEARDPAVLRVSAQEPDTREPVWILALRGVLGKDPRIAARFRSLALAIRQLNHPNIASIRAVGEQEGLPYMVIRALEKAQPLATRLDQPWAVDAAADVVMQAGGALEHAYNKGVLHGNLSPGNIWVEKNGRVQVTGLGVKQMLDLLEERLKQADSPYLAPERRAGEPVDARADVYSLGAILYEMLAQRAPVVIQERLLPAGRFNSDVPEAMDPVISKALSRDPAARYPNVRSFLAALGAVALAPAIRAVARAAEPRVCPSCGTRNAAGSFCTRCGAPLSPPAGAEPAAGAGEPALARAVIEVAPAVTASVAVASGEMAALFPAPLPMPQVDLAGLWAGLGDQIRSAMPEPLPMPAIDWAEVAPPAPEIPED